MYLYSSFSFFDHSSSMFVYQMLYDTCRYRPMLSVDFVVAELGFTNSNDCVTFLKEKGAILVNYDSQVDCKSCSAAIQNL